MGKYKAFSEILTMLLGIKAGANCGELKRLLNLLCITELPNLL